MASTKHLGYVCVDCEVKQVFARQVREWLQVRLSSALSSNQPLQTAVDLVQSAKVTTCGAGVLHCHSKHTPCVVLDGQTLKKCKPTTIICCFESILMYFERCTAWNHTYCLPKAL